MLYDRIGYDRSYHLVNDLCEYEKNVYSVVIGWSIL